jgi:rod shape-determining protein MreD
MLTRFGLILLIYTAAVFDTSAPVIPGNVMMDWLMLVAIGIIWTMPPGEAAAWGALIGLTADAISGGRMGDDVLAFSTLACLFAALRQRWECRSLLALALFAMAAAGSFRIITTVVRHMGTPSNSDVLATLLITVGSAAATGILAVLMAAAWRALRGIAVQFHSPARA